MTDESDVQADKYYSVDEVNELIGNLDAAVLTKLYRVASNLSMIYRYDPQDLVHDAIDRLLDPDGRRWRKDFSIFTIFKKICWSILDHYVEQNELESSLNIQNDDGTELIEDLPGKFKSSEQQLILVNIRDHIYTLFEEDPVAKDLIEGQMTGYKKEELLELLEISDKEYETAWKRIRRKMKRDYQRSMV